MYDCDARRSRRIDQYVCMTLASEIAEVKLISRANSYGEGANARRAHTQSPNRSVYPPRGMWVHHSGRGYG